MTRIFHNRPWWIVGVLLIANLGCQETTAPAQQPGTAQVSERVAPLSPRETWDVYFIGDAKVGYSHTKVEALANGQVQTTNFSEMTMQRFGQTITQQVTVSAVESQDGQPVSFSAAMKAGPAEMKTTGKWAAGKLTLSSTTLGKAQTSTIDWQRAYGGVFAGEQTLVAQPMKPGEKRTLQALIPIMNTIGELQFTAHDVEQTKLLEGAADLLKIDYVTVISGTKIDTAIWVDEHGEILKSYLPQLKQTTYRTTQKVALSKEGAGAFDLGTSTIVKVKRQLDRPHATKKIVYKATLPDGDIKDLFVSGPTQQVKVLDEHTAEVTVTAITPDEPKQLSTPEAPPTDDDLKPNNLIQSDDKTVIALANSVAQDEQDPGKIALALEGLVHRTITAKNFTQAFATAAEVAQSKEGDCTEHAVLLAALLKARGIPARGAMGLVYYPSGGGYAYHMWTEAWIKDRWIPLDATLGRGGIGAAHLKLAHSNLKGADAYSAFLPVFRVLGQLKLEVVEVE